MLFRSHPDDEILGCGGTIARLIQEVFETYTFYTKAILRQIEEMGIASDVITLHLKISYAKKRS